MFLNLTLKVYVLTHLNLTLIFQYHHVTFFFNFTIGDGGTREEYVVVGEGNEDDAILVV